LPACSSVEERLTRTQRMRMELETVFQRTLATMSTRVTVFAKARYTTVTTLSLTFENCTIV
jgi:hypothetical protein